MSINDAKNYRRAKCCFNCSHYYNSTGLIGKCTKKQFTVNGYFVCDEHESEEEFEDEIG